MSNKTLISGLILVIAVWCGAAAAKEDPEPPDSLGRIVDSLFVRASSGEIKFQAEVEPSRKALIALGIKAVPRLLSKLDTRDAREMLAITEIFKGIGEAAVESLISVLKSDDGFVRRLAIRCLGEIKSDKAVWPLQAMAQHRDFRTRVETMTALGNIGSSAASAAVQAGLNDSIELVATAAAVACGKIKKDIDPNALLAVLTHRYYGVRFAAARSLSLIGESVIAPVSAYLDSSGDVNARCFALLSLAVKGSEKSVKTLSRFAESESWQLRAAAADALGMTGIRKAESILKKMMAKDDHPLVKAKAKAALAALD